MGGACEVEGRGMRVIVRMDISPLLWKSVKDMLKFHLWRTCTYAA